MNYLAHLYLSRDCPETMLGNLMGDFVRGDPSQYPERIRRGIRLHRKIDAFTDSHPIALASRRRFEPGLRRYGGVLVDVFYDHFLAASWPEHATQPLSQFTASVYALLRDQAPLMPERMREMAPRMAQEDWLCSYAEVEGIRDVLRRMERRLRRPAPLSDGVEVLLRDYDGFLADFREFFPQLRRFVTAEQARSA